MLPLLTTFGKNSRCLCSFFFFQNQQGNWKNDHAHGEGTLIYAKGDVFNGEWANGVKNGQGQLTYKNGDLFQGSWIDDHANGHGRFCLCVLLFPRGVHVWRSELRCADRFFFLLCRTQVHCNTTMDVSMRVSGKTIDVTVTVCLLIPKQNINMKVNGIIQEGMVRALSIYPTEILLRVHGLLDVVPLWNFLFQRTRPGRTRNFKHGKSCCSLHCRGVCVINVWVCTVVVCRGCIKENSFSLSVVFIPCSLYSWYFVRGGVYVLQENILGRKVASHPFIPRPSLPVCCVVPFLASISQICLFEVAVCQNHSQEDEHHLGQGPLG